MTAPHDVIARGTAWMIMWLETKRDLYQEDACYHLRRIDPRLVYETEAGGQGINRDVLREFHEELKDRVSWDRGEKMWRLRKSSES